MPPWSYLLHPGRFSFSAIAVLALARASRIALCDLHRRWRVGTRPTETCGHDRSIPIHARTALPSAHSAFCIYLVWSIHPNVHNCLATDFRRFLLKSNNLTLDVRLTSLRFSSHSSSSLTSLPPLTTLRLLFLPLLLLLLLRLLFLYLSSLDHSPPLLRPLPRRQGERPSFPALISSR